jgi:hypothetical protein
VTSSGDKGAIYLSGETSRERTRDQNPKGELFEDTKEAAIVKRE